MHTISTSPNKSKLKIVGRSGDSWIEGFKCPSGSLGTYISEDLNEDYNLEEAKEECASGCNDRPDCFFASLYYTSGSHDCYLAGSYCGSWYSQSSYHLYQKGIKIL